MLERFAVCCSTPWRKQRRLSERTHKRSNGENRGRTEKSGSTASRSDARGRIGSETTNLWNRLWFVVSDPIRPRQPACVAGRPSNRLRSCSVSSVPPFVKSVASVILRCLYTEVKIGLGRAPRRRDVRLGRNVDPTVSLVQTLVSKCQEREPIEIVLVVDLNAFGEAGSRVTRNDQADQHTVHIHLMAVRRGPTAQASTVGKARVDGGV